MHRLHSLWSDSPLAYTASSCPRRQNWRQAETDQAREGDQADTASYLGGRVTHMPREVAQHPRVPGKPRAPHMALGLRAQCSPGHRRVTDASETGQVSQHVVMMHLFVLLIPVSSPTLFLIYQYSHFQFGRCRKEYLWRRYPFMFLCYAES